ncbi:hypothetical protein ABW20_dc0109491 [Dactylellina cionopaga]|nr:hypothetical protein ABW20_dc0109491 [Dactylellina cionopaga]
MFPASNAFAYGSQAMMFDVPLPGESSTEPNFSREGRMSTGSGRQSFGTGSPSFDNVEVQLYGPLPPYVYSIENSNPAFGAPAATYASVSVPVTAASSAGPDHMAFDNFGHVMADRGQPKLSGQYPVNLDDFLKMGMNEEDWEPLFGNQRSH